MAVTMTAILTRSRSPQPSLAVFPTSGIRKGESGFRISDTIRTLTGTEAQTLEQFFEKNAEVFGGVREGVSLGRS